MHAKQTLMAYRLPMTSSRQLIEEIEKCGDESLSQRFLILKLGLRHGNFLWSRRQMTLNSHFGPTNQISVGLKPSILILGITEPTLKSLWHRKFFAADSIFPRAQRGRGNIHHIMHASRPGPSTCSLRIVLCNSFQNLRICNDKMEQSICIRGQFYAGRLYSSETSTKALPQTRVDVDRRIKGLISTISFIGVIVVRIWSQSITTWFTMMHTRGRPRSNIRNDDPCTCILHRKDQVNKKLTARAKNVPQLKESLAIERMITAGHRTPFRHFKLFSTLPLVRQPGTSGAGSVQCTSLDYATLTNGEPNLREDPSKNHSYQFYWHYCVYLCQEEPKCPVHLGICGSDDKWTAIDRIDCAINSKNGQDYWLIMTILWIWPSPVADKAPDLNNKKIPTQKAGYAQEILRSQTNQPNTTDCI